MRLKSSTLPRACNFYTVFCFEHALLRQLSPAWPAALSLLCSHSLCSLSRHLLIVYPYLYLCSLMANNSKAFQVVKGKSIDLRVSVIFLPCQ